MHEDPDDAPGWLTLTTGAMALMSACANPRSDLPAAEAARLRALVRDKLLSSLCLLHAHPQAPLPLRQVAARVHQHWQTLLAAPAMTASAGDGAAATPPLLH